MRLLSFFICHLLLLVDSFFYFMLSLTLYPIRDYWGIRPQIFPSDGQRQSPPPCFQVSLYFVLCGFPYFLVGSTMNLVMFLQPVDMFYIGGLFFPHKIAALLHLQKQKLWYICKTREDRRNEDKDGKMLKLVDWMRSKL